MGKIEQNKQKKRRLILQAAQDIFLSEGYVLANMDRIAAQAQVTKQTVYRYYGSKTELFRATLEYIGESAGADFADSLQQTDSRQALIDFGRRFIEFHLTEEHLATYRLLITEGAKAPEILDTFKAVGPDDTSVMLEQFFSQRLGSDMPAKHAELWTGMLLSLRGGVLMGMAVPDAAQIEQHVVQTTGLLLSGLAE